MFSPFTLPPHPSAQAAAREVINKVHAYMRANPDSELHRKGKMFGVLIYDDSKYIAAFSAQLDGRYDHEGFVPPVWNSEHGLPVGHSREESQRLQRLLFANYRFTNGRGESKNLLEIFKDEKPILSPEEWFNGKRSLSESEHIPPAGAGECCAPKLMQYALSHGLRPIALAEFWVGAPPKNELRQEGVFYAPCSGKCVPILRHMLQGLEVIPAPETRHAEELCRQIDVLYDDTSLMVVNKPAGLLSVPGTTDEPSLASYLLQQRDDNYLQPVHRLDQDTSGILVLAKTQEVYKTLQAYFQRRDILKRYEAVVRPNRNYSLINQVGEIRLPLLPNPYDRPRQMVDYEHGKTAVTTYRLRELRSDGTVFLDLYPQTGRTHQLRVHAAHPDGLDAPIVGDRLYGTGQQQTHNERLMLHAAEISFMHPVTKEEMHFCIPSHF